MQKRGAPNGLRFFGDDFAVFPDVNRRAVHTGRFSRDSGGAAQGTSHGGGEFLRFFLYPSAVVAWFFVSILADFDLNARTRGFFR